MLFTWEIGLGAQLVFAMTANINFRNFESIKTQIPLIEIAKYALTKYPHQVSVTQSKIVICIYMNIYLVSQFNISFVSNNQLVGLYPVYIYAMMYSTNITNRITKTQTAYIMVHKLSLLLNSIRGCCIQV